MRDVRQSHVGSAGTPVLLRTIISRPGQIVPVVITHMPNYRRAFRPGGTFFFTLVTYRRARFLCDERARALLRRAIDECRAVAPFEVDAFVLLVRSSSRDLDAAARRRRLLDAVGADQTILHRRVVRGRRMGRRRQRLAPPQPSPGRVATTVLGTRHPRRGIRKDI